MEINMEIAPPPHCSTMDLPAGVYEKSEAVFSSFRIKFDLIPHEATDDNLTLRQQRLFVNAFNAFNALNLYTVNECTCCLWSIRA